MAVDDTGRWTSDSIEYKVRVGVVMSLYVIYIFYVVITFTMFIKRSKDKHSGLAQRNINLVTLQVASGFLMGTVGMFSTALQLWPAFLRLWFTNIGYMVMYSAVLGRGFQHIVVSNLHILTNQIASTKNPGFKNMMPQSNLAVFHESKRHDRSASQSSVFSNAEFDISGNGRNTFEKRSVANFTKHGRQESMIGERAPEMRLYRKLQKYTRLQRYATDRSMLIFALCNLILAIIVSLVVNILNEQFSLKPMSMVCRLVWGFIPVMVIVGSYVIFLMPIIFVKCWKLKDAYGIRNDVLICIIMGVFCIIMNTVWDVVLQDIALKWSGWFFSWVTGVVIHTVSVTVPLFDAIRHSRDVTDRMHGVGSLGVAVNSAIANASGRDMSNRSDYNAILADPHEYRYFCDFAASCFCSEMTAFIDEYQALKGLTVVALGADDLWRGNADQLEPSFMSRMVTNTIDDSVGYLALANGSTNVNARSLRLQTPPTISILDTAKVVYPQYEFNENTPFPVASMDKLVAIFSVFINSNSYTSVNLPAAMVFRLRDRLGTHQLTLTILDEIKDEVLNMLYLDVFTRYAKRK
ncbi:hypothetical protein LPJ53_002934 [Coemansia erecta]|uniref:RGS domain-containing protein n=1 Tax=Coemansia erecta TaxID=147472 RepID=A0A9W7Y0B8_9FUNG|nr:hypothetical protein LPJ53_002934 [Coemansia erecta]